MKLSVILFSITVVTLGGIELLHIAQHNTYCKTESEWIKTLPEPVQRQLRN